MICQTVVPVGLELPTKLAPVYNAAWSEANQSLILLKMIMYQTYTRLIPSVLCPLHLFASMTPLHSSVHMTSWYHDTCTSLSSYDPITPSPTHHLASHDIFTFMISMSMTLMSPISRTLLLSRFLHQRAHNHNISKVSWYHVS